MQYTYIDNQSYISSTLTQSVIIKQVVLSVHVCLVTANQWVLLSLSGFHVTTSIKSEILSTISPFLVTSATAACGHDQDSAISFKGSLPFSV